MKYSTDADKAAEARLAKQIEALHPGYRLHRYAEFDRLDWWVECAQRCVGFVEMKSRDVASTTYPTVYVSFQKWLAMFLGWTSSGLPHYFVVGYTDGVQRFIDIRDVDARNTFIQGRRDRGTAVNAIEPIVEVPVSQLLPLERLFGKVPAPRPMLVAPTTQPVSDRMAGIFGERDDEAPWNRRRVPDGD